MNIMEEDKIYFNKEFKLGKFTNLRTIYLVIRKKKFYEKSSISIWWKYSIGCGIIGHPNKEFKYFMLGLSLFNINGWVNFKWVGSTKLSHKLNLKD